MDLDKAMLDELTAGFKTPQELETLYAQMLQHMINQHARKPRCAIIKSITCTTTI